MKTFTIDDLEQATKKVINSENYGAEFELIREALKKYPKNNDKIIIAFKISLIDVTNSTNINKYKSKLSLNKLVNNIYEIKDFDERVKQGDIKLIKEIAEKNGEINLFSFATKYCCYHNTIIYERDDYSIYDSVLRDHIPEYTENITKHKIECWRKEKDYESYHNCISKILENNKIDIKEKRRKFDRYIWSKYRTTN